MFRSNKPISNYDQGELTCDTVVIEQKQGEDG